MGVKRNRRWTEEDDRRLLELRAGGRSAVSISAVLKRSVGAVEGRLSIIRSRPKACKDAINEGSSDST
jgi:hypothetical protein